MKSTRSQSLPRVSTETPKPPRSRAPRQSLQSSASAIGVPLEGPEDDSDDSQFVGSVARALSVLDAFRAGDGPLGNAELAERTKLTKPTVSRLAYTLARCGYLSFNPRYREYQLGPRLIALGHAAVATTDVREIARPLMQDLARHATFNVGLGMRDQHQMIYTDACEGDALVGLRLYAGSRIPIMTSAMGRAYLAGLDGADREALLAELKPSHGTSEWAAQCKALDKAIQEVEKKGFCVSAGDWHKDIHGVAAPIRSGDGKTVYAINLGGPAYLLPESRLRGELGKRIAQAAQEIESALRS